ncbi:MAG: hypothetical protein LLF89_11000, partial [Spirochaetaceae bacterium]|nr:hypothetical protein [Spirochaetaceae bacterium]
MKSRISGRDLIKIIVALVGIAVISFAVTIAVKVSNRNSQFKAAGSAFATVLKIDSMAFNDGYFSWTSLQENVASGDLVTAREQLLDISFLYPFILEVSLENKAPPGGEPLIESDGERLFMRFSIKDDYGNKPLPDWRGVVEIDSQALLDALRSENRLHVDARNGKELAYSLKADFADPLLTWSDHLIVLLATLAIGFPLSVGISRKSRF